ncbi:c-type cytochrome [Pontibacter sp. Tf4]|uniref:cytochrome c4 n=1 Tax=Pontibacter sp. Tf4 TaxID=2761620 RepID=UPI0016259E26|nr:c-type cytochrome [Pontibacter sp. Tf4]MBB6612663.1 c-type cytochrome [Pontibacter sp. Tf4]
MKKLKKVLLYVSIGVLVVLLGAIVAFQADFYLRSQKTYNVQPRPVEIAFTPEALQNGRHLAIVKGCNDCHGKDMGGKIMIDDPAVGLVTAPNITKGTGGLPASYAATDYIRALRHGLGTNNRSLLVMPAHETSKLSDEDVAALVAYCMQLPPVNRTLPASEFNVMGKALTMFGVVPAFAAEAVDHTYLQPKEMLKEVSLEYGEYLAVSCSGCHKANYKGGPSPVPGFPPIPDISSTGRVGQWSKAQFATVLRSGQLPDGRVMRNEDMPWKMTAYYTDEEVESIYLYLRSLK